jgi:hypothetical protein
MKIKDLPKDKNLGGIKVKTTEGRIGYWKSQWRKGVWLTDTPNDTHIHPVFLDDLKDVLEWEVLTDKI